MLLYGSALPLRPSYTQAEGPALTGCDWGLIAQGLTLPSVTQTISLRATCLERRAHNLFNYIA